MNEYPSGPGLPSDPLTSNHGGTGLSTSGSDSTKSLMSDGSGGFIMAISGGTPTLTNSHILVGNVSNVATDVVMSGDATISNAGVVTVTKTGGISFAAVATSGAVADVTGAAHSGANTDINSLGGNCAGLFSGGVQTIATLTATLTATSASLINLTHAGAIVITLPDATTCVGKLFFLYTFNGTSIAIKTVSSQTVNGVAVGGGGLLLANAPSTGDINGTVFSDGTNWHTLGAPLTPQFGQGQANLVAINRGSTWGQSDNAAATGQPLLAGGGSNTTIPGWGPTVEHTTTTTASTLGLTANSDRNQKLDCTSNAITVTLSDATACATKRYTFTKIDSTASAVTFNTTSAQTIGGVASGSLTINNQWGVLDIYSDGTNWQINNCPANFASIPGMFSGGVQTVSGNISLTASSASLQKCASGSYTITLPDATTCVSKLFLFQGANGSNAQVTFATASSQTIGGFSASKTFIDATGGVSAVGMFSDGSNWQFWLPPVSMGNGGGTPHGSIYTVGNGFFQTLLTPGVAGQPLLTSGSNATPGWGFTTEGTTTTTATTLAITANSNRNQKLDCTSNVITVTLPDATACTNKRLTFTKIDSTANSVTFNTTSSQTIGGVASGVLTLPGQWSGIDIYSDGTNWQVVSAPSNFGGQTGMFSGGVFTQPSNNYSLTLVNTSPSVIISNPSGGNLTVTLPDATTCSGKIFNVITIVGGGSTFIKTTSSQTIATFNNYSGAQTFISNAGGSVIVVSDGANWQVIGNSAPWRSNNSYGSLLYCDGYSTKWQSPGTTNSEVLWNSSGAPGSGSTVLSGATPSTNTAFNASSAKYIVATGTITLTFTPTANKEWYVFNNDANTKTFAAASGSVLGTQSLTSQNTMAIIFSDGTNIYVK